MDNMHEDLASNPLEVTGFLSQSYFSCDQKEDNSNFFVLLRTLEITRIAHEWIPNKAE